MSTGIYLELTWNLTHFWPHFYLELAIFDRFFQYINGETLVDLQNGLHNVEATIIDARYPYE